ncbi:hypothetical protein GCM10010185_63360 [Saccharothrix coeruleofusca]|uniref:Uncharacterized protein n=1 Tax=Saccharothrix coeruleofusca TaxID=33919 RepID=A0A918EGC0_9PSEU|nr:hypothetical protein GCM10010185_63360 [Saccharothrix coeruleofusca]
MSTRRHECPKCVIRMVGVLRPCGRAATRAQPIAAWPRGSHSGSHSGSDYGPDHGLTPWRASTSTATALPRKTVPPSTGVRMTPPCGPSRGPATTSADGEHRPIVGIKFGGNGVVPIDHV